MNEINQSTRAKVKCKVLRFHGSAFINGIKITNWTSNYNTKTNFREWEIDQTGLVKIISGTFMKPHIMWLIIEESEENYDMFVLHTDLEILQAKVKYGVED